MAALAHFQFRLPEVRANYDRTVDVLHVMRAGEPMGVEGDGLPNGVELVYSLRDGSPWGVTVLGFRRNGWDRNSDELASIAAKHLGLPRSVARKAISQAVR